MSDIITQDIIDTLSAGSTIDIPNHCFFSVMFSPAQGERRAVNCQIYFDDKLIAHAVTSDFQNSVSIAPQTLTVIVPRNAKAQVRFSGGNVGAVTATHIPLAHFL